MQTRAEGEDNRTTIKWFEAFSFLGAVIELASHHLQRFDYVVISSTPFPVVPVAVTNVCLYGPTSDRKLSFLAPALSIQQTFYISNTLHAVLLSSWNCLVKTCHRDYRIDTLYIFMGLSSLITGAWALSLLWMSNIHKYFCEEIPDP